MDGNDKIYPCFDMKTGDYILFGEYNTISQKNGNNELQPGTLYFKGFRGLFFEIDTQIDTESQEALFTPMFTRNNNICFSLNLYKK